MQNNKVKSPVQSASSANRNRDGKLFLFLFGTQCFFHMSCWSWGVAPYETVNACSHFWNSNWRQKFVFLSKSSLALQSWLLKVSNIYLVTEWEDRTDRAQVRASWRRQQNCTLFVNSTRVTALHSFYMKNELVFSQSVARAFFMFIITNVTKNSHANNIPNEPACHI